MNKKFKVNRTKIKGGCQSGRKVVTHNSKSDLPLLSSTLKRLLKLGFITEIYSDNFQNLMILWITVAAKETYREILSLESKDSITWIHLFGTQALIKERMEARKQHFMNSNLVQSQFEALEIPEYGIHIDVSNDPDTIISTIISKI